MTTPLTPPGFDISNLNSWDYLLNPSKYARQELIRHYGFATTEEAQAVYDQAIARSQQKAPFDKWMKDSCTIL